MNYKFRIYTFGSDRHYQNFKKRITDSRFEVVRINEKSENQNRSKSDIEIFNEFESIYKENIETRGFIIFGRATVQDGIENIAKAVNLIKKKYPELKHVQVIGPSVDAAKIFSDKFLTQKVLAENVIPTPRTYMFNSNDTKDFEEIINNINFPIVLKALNLSGGRGMRFVKDKFALKKNISDLEKKGIYNLIMTEFIKGIEVTYTILRLDDTFLRLPVSYKKDTDEQLSHPDSKVKLAGFYDGYNQHYCHIEALMRKYNIYGLFSLQGILKNIKSNQFEVYFLEAAVRVTGSTPIMVAAFEGFDLYKTIADWIMNKKIDFSYERSYAIQYSSYLHKGLSSVKELLKLDWVFEAKYENLANLPYADDKRDRIKISFKVDPQKNLSERLRVVGDILENPLYQKEVSDVLYYFQGKNLERKDLKCLEGAWNENVSWEFYLSDYLPERELCSAVFALLKHENKVILTRTRRGWEMPGGHIENNETIEDALQREIMEEAGANICRFKFIGYRKIIAKKPANDSKRNVHYPFPVSYIPHYVAIADTDLVDPTGDPDEVLDVHKFSLNELKKLEIEVGPIISICVKKLSEIN